MTEIWRAVVDYEGLYEVSDHGRVRSIDRVQTYQRVDRNSGTLITVERRLKGKMLRPGRMPGGHLSVAIGKGNSVCVHVLVLDAFVGRCPPKQEARHFDDVPGNNVLGNLSWGTRSENLYDAVRTGHKPVGDRHSRSKLKEADIPTIRSLFGRTSYSDIARQYGVSERTIRQIKDGYSWKHVRATHAD